MILLAPYGSRGDVQPVAAIGRELAKRGHDVVLCAPPDHAHIAAAAGLRFVSVGPPQSHLFDGTQSNTSTFRAALRVAPQLLEALEPLASEARIIIGSALQFAAPALALSQGIPYVYVMLSPVYLRTAALSPLGASNGPLQRAIHEVRLALDDAAQLRQARWLRSLRRQWNQPRIRSLERYLTRSGTIFLVSDPVLAPMPREDPVVVHTGHVYLPSTDTLATDVEAFLKDGPPPLYIGFGSMKHIDATRLAQALVGGARLAGRRAIVHESLARHVPELATAADVLVTNDLSHAALFPRVAACVHHGGYGTTIEAARAGTPQVILPHLGDQFHHAERAAALGIAAAPIALKAATAQTIRDALEFACRPETVARARVFGEGLIEREGTGRCADRVESLMQERRLTPAGN